MNKLATIALLSIIGAALGLVLLPGLATTVSPLKYYGYSTVTTAKEPVNIEITPGTIDTSAGEQGQASWSGWIKVTPGSNVEAVKLKVKLLNAKELKKYFDYLVIYIKLGSEVKGILSLDRTVTEFVLDSQEMGSGSAQLDAEVYYEIKEGMLVSSLPISIEVDVVSVT